jgi:hypothetical protein
MANLMSRRLDAKGTSTGLIRFRTTDEEGDEMRGTAEYLEESLSEYFRRLHQQERRNLIDSGHRPPKKPREK